MKALFSQCIRFCLLYKDIWSHVWVWLCRSVKKDINDFSDLTLFSFMSFFALKQAVTFSCCLCVLACFYLVSAALELLPGLTVLLWRYVSPCSSQTIYFPLTGQRQIFVFSNKSLIYLSHVLVLPSHIGNSNVERCWERLNGTHRHSKSSVAFMVPKDTVLNNTADPAQSVRD